MEEETIVERLEKEINITHPQALEIQLKLYDIVVPILCSIIILINLPIVFSSGIILHKRQQPRSTYIFLGNEALSDLLIGITFLCFHYYPEELRNEMTCCISLGLNVCSALVSVFTVGLIGIDRYLYILNGLQYQRYMFPQRARGMVFGTWFFAGIISFLPAFGIRNPTDNGKLCWFIVLVPSKLVLITTSLGMIPLCLVVILYIIILKHALVRISYVNRASDHGTQIGDLRLFRGSSKTSIGLASADAPNVTSPQEARKVSSENRRSIFNCCRRTHKPKNNVPAYSGNKWKAIKIVLLPTGAFIITWCPYFIGSMLYAMCNPYSDPDYCESLRVALASPLTILGLCNSLLNPIIYAWWHNGFRESVKKMFRGLVNKRYNKNKDTANISRLTSVTRSTQTSIKLNQILEQQNSLAPIKAVKVKVNSLESNGNHNFLNQKVDL